MLFLSFVMNCNPEFSGERRAFTGYPIPCRWVL